MTYPPGGTPDPYQPVQPYGQPYDPATPYPSADPYAPPAGGMPGTGHPYATPEPYAPPASGMPGTGQPYATPDPYAPPASGMPATGQPYAAPYPPPLTGMPYGQQPPYAAAAHNPALRTNTMAILALVFAFVFAPAAIVFGHVAKRQVRQTGEGGDGLATAGLWLGYIFTGLWAAGCGLWLIILIAMGTSGSTT